MPYVSEWVALAAALKELLAAGQNEDEAKADLCSAIADHAIELRACFADGSVLGNGYIDVPRRLNPENFDWPRSRPRTPWHRRQTVADSYFDRDLTLDVSMLELRRDSLTTVFPGKTPTRSTKPCQNAVDQWFLGAFQQAHDDGKAAPKRMAVFADCHTAIRATDRQMRAAMHKVPLPLRRTRGDCSNVRKTAR